MVQAKVVGAFAGSGTLANGDVNLSWRTRHFPNPSLTVVLGLMVGALIVSYTTWPWIFYITAILALLIAITCTTLIPHTYRPQNKYTQLEQFRRLDIFGTSLLIGEPRMGLANYFLPKSTKPH